MAPVAAGLLMLLIAAGFLARSRWIIGPPVAERLRVEAARRGVDLEVGHVRPAGLFDIALLDVAVRVPRGGLAIEAVFDEVRLSVDLDHLLRHRQLRLDRVELDGGRAALVPFRRAPSREGSTAAPGAEANQASTSQPAPSTRSEATEAPHIPPVELLVRDLRLQLLGTHAASRPVHLIRGSAIWRPDAPAATTLASVSAYGTLPDGVPFGASVGGTAADPEEPGARLLTVRVEGETHLDAWLLRSMPVTLSARAFDLCLSCDALALTLRDVELGLPLWREDVVVRTPSATLQRVEGQLRLASPEMEIVDARRFDFTARLTRTRLDYDPDSGVVDGALQLVDPGAGTLDLDWQLSDEQVAASFWGDRFDLSTIWELTGLGDPLDPGHLDGTVDAIFDLRRGTVDLETALRLSGARIDLPFVAAEPLDFSRIGVWMEALVDLDGRALSIANGRLAFGSAQALSFDGRAVDARRGWSFFGRVRAEELDVQALRDGLPRALTDVLEGSQLEGAMSFALTAAGHTAFPESLILDGTLDGEVDVRREGDVADATKLLAPGRPPLLDDELAPARWTAYDELPPMIPAVLLAAEDAQFFGHSGFDWDGFRRAMIHNLARGALARGGSTLSQQVVKNVFLRPDRTLTRKLQEAYLTWRMESVVPKERILEIYLNIANWGGGARGVAEASRRYFDATPDELSVAEMALLAAILPGPDLFGAKIRRGELPASRLEKMEHIFSNLRFLGEITPGEYTALYDAAKRGEVGRLRLRLKE